jgi:hypothetical protein
VTLVTQPSDLTPPSAIQDLRVTDP